MPCDEGEIKYFAMQFQNQNIRPQLLSETFVLIFDFRDKIYKTEFYELSRRLKNEDNGLSRIRDLEQIEKKNEKYDQISRGLCEM